MIQRNDRFRIVRSCCYHRSMCSTTGTSCRHEVFCISWKISKNNIILYKTDCIFLICQAERCITGIVFLPILVRCRTLLATVSTCYIDISICRIAGRCLLIFLCTVSCCSCIYNNRCCRAV